VPVAAPSDAPFPRSTTSGSGVCSASKARGMWKRRLAVSHSAWHGDWVISKDNDIKTRPHMTKTDYLASLAYIFEPVARRVRSRLGSTVHCSISRPTRNQTENKMETTMSWKSAHSWHLVVAYPTVPPRNYTAFLLTWDSEMGTEPRNKIP
jgi:hypothetical protein